MAVDDPSRARALATAPGDAPDDVIKAIEALQMFQQCVLGEDDKKYDAYLTPLFSFSVGLAKRQWRMDQQLIDNIYKLLNGETEKRGRRMALIHGGIVANQIKMLRMSQCPVCKRPADSAHKCYACGQVVHSIICSDPVGEEGHGQAVLCHLCLGERTNHNEKEINAEEPKISNFYSTIEEDEEAANNLRAQLLRAAKENQNNADSNGGEMKENKYANPTKDDEPTKDTKDIPVNENAGKEPPKDTKDNPLNKNVGEESQKDTKDNPLNENAGEEPPEKDAQDREKRDEDDPCKTTSIEMIKKVLQFFSHNADKLQSIRGLCDATAKLGKIMTDGVTNKHWLLNPDTARSIHAMVSMDMEGKRASAMTSIISGVNTSLQKNIDTMERAAFCPICKKPAPRTNVCEKCSKPTHLNCGDRQAGHPEFYCSVCLANPGEEPPDQATEDNQSGQAIDETIPESSSDSESQANPTPTEPTVNEPAIPDDVCAVTEYVTSECFTRECFHESIDLAQVITLDGGWIKKWEEFLSGRFTDPTRPVTPDDWSYFFAHAFVEDIEMPDTFDSECEPIDEKGKSTIREIALSLACMAPTRFGYPTCRYNEECRVLTLTKGSSTCAWIGANQVIGSVWIGIRSFQQNLRSYVLVTKAAKDKMNLLREDGNESKRDRVDRILSTLDGSTEYLRCLGVCEVWAEMMEKPRLELMMPWNDSLRFKWNPLTEGFPKVQTTNKHHAAQLMTLWQDRETVNTLPDHMKRAAVNKPKIGWPRFKALWIKGRQLASDFWFSNPELTKEQILDKMEAEFSDTTSIETLTAASEAYRKRILKIAEAAARIAEAEEAAEAAESEEKKIEETIQLAEKELEQIQNASTQSSPGKRVTRSRLPTNNAKNREAIEAAKRLDDLKKQKQEKESERKRKIEEATAAENEATEAYKKPKPAPTPKTKGMKKPKAEFTSLTELVVNGEGDTDPPIRCGQRLTHRQPGAVWKAAAIQITSMLSICHDILKTECDNLGIKWTELEKLRSDLDTKRMIADYSFLAGKVASFKEDAKREPTVDEMTDFVQDIKTCKSPTLDLYLSDAFVEKAIIALELLDTSEFLDMDSGEVIEKNIKVKHLRPSLLSWMTVADAADLCWHLKCIEHIKTKKKEKEFRLLIKLNFGAEYKEKMLSLFNKLVGKAKKKKKKKKKQGN